MRPGFRCGIAIAAALLVASSANLGQVLATETSGEWRNSVMTSGAGVVQIDSSAGSLVVTGWDRDQVEVSGTVAVGAGTAEPQLERNGERVVVRLHQAPGQGTASHLEVRMPRRHRLELSGLSLDVTIEGLAGGIDVSVVSGTVRVRGGVAGDRSGAVVPAEGSVRLETVSGVLRVEGAFEELEMHSVSGPLEVAARVRRLTVESESGPQTLRLREVERADVASLDGPIYLGIESASVGGGQVTAGSFRGVLAVALPATSNVQVDALVRAGRITNLLGGNEEREGGLTKDEAEGGTRLRTRLGDGTGARLQVDLSTFRGDIELRPLEAP